MVSLHGGVVQAAEGGSYNPMYGTLYDGALASAVVAGDNAGPWRDSMLSPGRQHQPGAVPSHAHAHGNANTQQQQRDAVLPVVSEGLVLWRQLLQSWAVYRRWLEVRSRGELWEDEDRPSGVAL